MQKRYVWFISVLSSFVIALMILIGWLYEPYEQTEWRVKLSVPIIGSLSLPIYPAVQLATSSLGRRFLHNTEWRTKYGLVKLQDQAAGLRISCEACVIQIPAFSKQPIIINTVRLNIQVIEQKLSGTVEINQPADQVKFTYTGRINTEGIDVNWSLPKTQVTKLVALIQNHSPILQRARVNGSLAVTGTLHWPNLSWDAKPEVQGFTVAGLGTERLKTLDIKYRCPSQGNSTQAWQNYWVDEKHMGRWLPRAVIIAEDAHFKEHPGFNLETIRTLLIQKNHHKLLGGSTLTQQLAKNFFTGGERSWLRKLEELFYAVEMENTLGKRRILNLYLNTVELGPGICGIAQASAVYFAKTPAQLTPMQAAWLAGIIRNPHRAWQQQYLANMPDIKRPAWVLSFMPKRLRQTRYAVVFHKSA